VSSHAYAQRRPFPKIKSYAIKSIDSRSKLKNAEVLVQTGPRPHRPPKVNLAKVQDTGPTSPHTQCISGGLRVQRQVVGTNGEAPKPGRGLFYFTPQVRDISCYAPRSDALDLDHAKSGLCLCPRPMRPPRCASRRAIMPPVDHRSS
jgi:hypothetical protein